ncbi:lysophospholipid acyltransferase family protein [Phyllobacterium myrsinacearum]|uniref:1-acyl-sn-glycerol-3-phosphate acyltransferase n=1 Tax=Phyllobacterium myrsinacearum TaxID=28101 RepID=A0A839EKV1_9HYPH|nr:1-acyl-sn-glycerol-3-phosphate acyltransferase [Phyllobacterium myrsinacearum]MBA8877340.1 1-acyl-sn-glycerol-3-phosphate acyltransferase [Phyllobacterium myrsinacearum]
MMSWVRFVFASTIFALVTLFALPLQYLFVKAGWNLQTKFPLRFHRIAAKLLGLRIHMHGDMATERPLLLAANHASWSDIVVLGSLKEISFIAKAEVADWPLFGMFAKLQRSVFVEREKRGKTHDQASEIATRLAAGDVMVLFAEGTTSDGNRVLPFKTSLFGAAQVAIRETSVETVTVQPVAIAYTRVHGVPMGRFHRPLISWPGDVPLGPSLIGLLKDGAIDVDVWFGEPMTIDSKTNRKTLARLMEERVRAMMLSSLLGRDLVTPAGESQESVIPVDSAILKDAKKL